MDYSAIAGAPASRIFAIRQDARGFLWLASPTGVVRFDGQRFISLPVRTGGTELDHRPLTLAVGGHRVYIATRRRVYRIQDDLFVPFAELPLPLRDPGSAVLAAGERGALWLGTRAGLCRFTERDRRCYDVEAGLPSTWIGGDVRGPPTQALAFDRQGRLWVATAGGVAFYQPDRDRFQEVLLSAGERVLSLAIEGDVLWAGTSWGRIGHLDPSGFTAALAIEGQPAIVALAPTASGPLWFGTTDRGLGRWWHGDIDWVDAGKGLPSSHIMSLCMGRDGMLWIGTLRGMARHGAAVARILSTPEGLVGQVVLDLAIGRRSTWVVTEEGGLQSYRDGVFRPVDIQGGPGRRAIRRVVEGASGELILATAEGLWRLEGKDLVRFHDDLPRGEMDELWVSPAGDLWIGTLRDGACRLSAAGAVRCWGHDEGVPGLGAGAFRADRTGAVWMVGPRGLARVEDDRIRTWTAADGLPLGHVVDLIMDEGDRVIMVTEEGGMVRFDGATFQVLPAADNLDLGPLCALVSDEAGGLWVAGSRGLARLSFDVLDASFDRGGGPIPVVRLGPTEGVVGLDCPGTARGGALRLPGGQLAFAAVGGLLWVDEPHRAGRPMRAPQAFVTRATVDGLGVPIGAGIEFLSGSRHLDIDLGIPLFAQAGRVRQRSRLEGFDTSWTVSEGGETIRYTNLRPGDYSLVVQASSDGVRWGPETRLPLSVRPRWFEGTIVRALGVAALLLLTTTTYRRRLALSQARRRALEAEVRRRTEELEKTNDRLEEAVSRLEQLATTDALTGLANRRDFDDHWHRERRRARRSRLPLSVIAIDVDNFKAYNDTFGHQQGDACLVEIASMLTNTLRRAGDVVARVGGEEFTLILPATDAAAAATIAEVLRQAVLDLALVHPHNPPWGSVTISLGVATWVVGEDDESVDLLARADDRLYEAKGGGRNRLVSEDPDGAPPPAAPRDES